MDVVYEEDDHDPLLGNRGTTPKRNKSTHRSRHDAGGGSSERFRRNTANSNESKKSRNHTQGSRSSHGSRNTREYQQPPISSRSRVKQELVKANNSIHSETGGNQKIGNIMIIQGG